MAAAPTKGRTMIQLAILGYGTRGRHLLQHARHAPLGTSPDITVFDPDPQITCEAHRAPTLSQAVATADLIVLALPDRLALVRKVTQVVQAACPPQAEILVLSGSHEQDALRSCAIRPMQIHGGLHADFQAAPLWRALTAAPTQNQPEIL